jgi:hypothetical protein
MRHIRWTAPHLSWLAERVRDSHSIIVGINTHENPKKLLVEVLPMYTRHTEDIQHVLGEIHDDIFSIVKQNGISFDELRGTGKRRELR